MTSKQDQESEALDLLLRHLRSAERVNYKRIERPEQDQTEPGTYDFLCKDESSERPDLAVEITTLMESPHRKAFDLAIDEIAADLVSKLSGKLPGEFELQIPGPTRQQTIAFDKSHKLRLSAKKVRYKELSRNKNAIVSELESRIMELAQDPEFLVGEQYLIHRPIVCDLIKSSCKGSSLTVRYDYLDPTMPANMGGGGFYAYLGRSIEQTFANKNRQLEIPKSAGKNTVLVLCVDLGDPLAHAFANVKNMQQLVASQPKETWSNIDRVFMQRGDQVFPISP